MFEQHTLVTVLLVGGVGAVGLAIVAGLALLRRRSISYLLITTAISAVALRVGIGVATVNNSLPVPHHHLLEHTLDAFIVVLLFGAIYAARTGDPRHSLDETPRHPRDD